MSLKIRLRQQGRRNSLSYRLVVTDSNNRRDGKYLECVGWYNPTMANEDSVKVNEERVAYWTGVGAQLSEKAKSLVAKKAPAVIKAIKEKKLKDKAKLAEKRKAKKSI